MAHVVALAALVNFGDLITKIYQSPVYWCYRTLWTDPPKSM